MSRAQSGDTVFVKPQNNIYTALAAAATVLLIMGILAVFMRSGEMFEGGLLGEAPTKSGSTR